jgi:hypothetical protein
MALLSLNTGWANPPGTKSCKDPLTMKALKWPQETAFPQNNYASILPSARCNLNLEGNAMSFPLRQTLLRCSCWVRWCQIEGLLDLVCCLACGFFQLREEGTQEDAYFEYHTLEDPSAYTRLLTLQPSPDYGDLVVCRLTAVRLDSAPPYEALSYHWGDRTHDQLIIVDGRQKLITRSLLLALKDLRRPFRSRILWADGLCINQSEEAVEERNAQYLKCGRSSLELHGLWHD